MKKRTVSALLAAALTASALTGCGGKAEAPAQEQTAQSQETQEDAKQESSEESVDISAAKESGGEVTITYANFNASGCNEESLQIL